MFNFYVSCQVRECILGIRGLKLLYSEGRTEIIGSTDKSMHESHSLCI